jgi:calcium-dependent protein kinase
VNFKASTFVKENKGKLKDFYKMGKLIGSGAFGDVRVCLHIETEQQRAAKIVQKSTMTKEDEEMLLNEIAILS